VPKGDIASATRSKRNRPPNEAAYSSRLARPVN